MDYIDLKYIRLLQPHLEQFKQVNPSTFNFRCPLCGDSRKDKTKARGYLVEKTQINQIIYFCHNCGSPDCKSLISLLKHISDTLYNDYVKEKFRSTYSSTPEEFKEETEKIEIKNTNKNLTHFELKRNSNKILENAISLEELHDIHPAKKYLKNRCIPPDRINELYYVDDVNKVTKNIEKYKDKDFFKSEAIIIPFRDGDGIINCIQFRLMGNSKLRYITLYVFEDKSKAIYGLDHLDGEKEIYVCEGPINSMFLDNGIAVAGASQFNKIKNYNNNVTLIFDNDYRCNPDVLRNIETAIKNNYKVVIFDDGVSTDEDINDLVIKNNWKQHDLMNYLRERTFQGLKAQLELAKFNKPKKQKPQFSNESSLMSQLKRTVRN